MFHYVILQSMYLGSSLRYFALELFNGVPAIKLRGGGRLCPPQWRRTSLKKTVVFFRKICYDNTYFTVRYLISQKKLQVKIRTKSATFVPFRVKVGATSIRILEEKINKAGEHLIPHLGLQCLHLED